MRVKTTIYLDEDLHRLLQGRAVRSGCSVSSLVNDAMRRCMSGDLSDIRIWEKRKSEPDVSFMQALKKIASSS